MATQNTTGVYQRKDGYWEYRFTITVNGKKIPRRKSTDASGMKLKTKKEARKIPQLSLYKKMYLR